MCPGGSELFVPEGGKGADGFDAHAGVVVGAFPEAGFVVGAVDGAVGAAA